MYIIKECIQFQDPFEKKLGYPPDEYKLIERQEDKIELINKIHIFFICPETQVG